MGNTKEYSKEYQRNYREKNREILNLKRRVNTPVLRPRTIIITLSYIYGSTQQDLAKYFKISQNAVKQHIQGGFRKMPQLQQVKRVTTKESVNLVSVGSTNDLEELAGDIATNGGRRNNRLNGIIRGEL